MRKNKKNLNKKKIFIVLLIIVFILYLYIKYNCVVIDYISNSSGTNLLKSQSTDEYKIIKQDNNNKYLGIGQQKVKNVDGYFSTFTTEDNHKKTYKEYKQNAFSWANNYYWGGTMEENGCGITAISTILSGYNKDYSPESLRTKYYPVLDSEQISNELSNTFGIKNSNFYYDSLHLSNKSILEHLKTNRPILICVWNQPSSNRWTTASHYMVLLACDNDKKVYVSNPNRW